MADLKKILFKYHQLFLPFIFIISLLIFWFFLMPRFNQIKKVYYSNQKERERIRSLQVKISDLETLNEYELTEKSEILLLALPSEKNGVAMMGAVSNLVEENGLVIESISVSPGEIATGSAEESAEESAMDFLPFRLTITGEITQFLNFLEAASQTLPLMDVEMRNFDITGEQSTSDCLIKFYYTGLPTTLGKIETPVPKLSSQEELFLDELQKFNAYQLEPFEPSVGGRANPFTF